MTDLRLKGQGTSDYCFRVANVLVSNKRVYSPYYTILWLEQAAGTCCIDTTTYALPLATHIFCLTPYQPYQFHLSAGERLVVIEFNTDFFCLERHQAEVGCNGILFNNVIESPFLSLNDAQLAAFQPFLHNITHELRMPNLAHRDLLLAYLKIFLIQATRLRTAEGYGVQAAIAPEKAIQARLHELIEAHYTDNWQAADYAAALNIAASSLAALLRKQHQKTLSQMLQDRLIIQAKRELYYYDEKPIKEIAYDLGFNDASYFIRFFKKATSLTPDEYRRGQNALIEA